MTEKRHKSKTRSASDGELIDADEDLRNEDDDRNCSTLPRSRLVNSSRRKYRFERDPQTPVIRESTVSLSRENIIPSGKPKKKGFRKPSMKSVGNLVNKMIRHMSQAIVPTPYQNRHTPLGKHERGSLFSASTTDVRSQNNRNNDHLKNITPGVTGLRNHGNTCFMNAILQCLCHTDILAEYFVMDQYKIDLTRRNKTNSKKYGTRGEVTEQLALLLKALWSCQYTPDISNQFKNVVGKYESQYLGSNQHDAQEFLLWLLDKVHEDLNTATKKKYKKVKSSQGRPDEVVAAEALANHMRCNSSFVHFLFQAQFRSSLTCPKCLRQSTTFDPFLCVSIPIPQRQMRPVFVTIVYLNQQPKQVKLGLSINCHATIKELREILAQDTGIPEKQLVLTDLQQDGFHQTFANSQPVGIIRENDDIYAIETPPQRPADEREGEFMILFWVNRLGTGTQGKRFGCPYVLQVAREASFDELQKLILTSMSSIMREGILEQKLGSVVRLRVVDGITGKCYLPQDVDHPLYMPTVDVALSKSEDDDVVVHLKLIVEWDLETRKRMIANVDDKVEEHSSVKQMKNQETQPVTASLSECFELYTQEEKLGPEDPWLCPSCKRMQQGVKKLSLWSVPDILIIHLKRFRQTPSQRIKLNTLVEFPIVGLDMTPHIVSRTYENHISYPNGLNSLTYWSPWRRHRRHPIRSEDHLYDLYAVCNHHGNMQGGHYTAYCRNPTDGVWYSFDDTKVKQLEDDTEIVNPSAYILFYQRRTLPSGYSSSASSSSSGSSEHWVYRMPTFHYTPPKFSKSQDNLISLDESAVTKLVTTPFTRGSRPYNSMAPLSTTKQVKEETEPEHYSDEEGTREENYPDPLYITESCV